MVDFADYFFYEFYFANTAIASKIGYLEKKLLINLNNNDKIFIGSFSCFLFCDAFSVVWRKKRNGQWRRWQKRAQQLEWNTSSITFERLNLFLILFTNYWNSLKGIWWKGL